MRPRGSGGPSTAELNNKEEDEEEVENGKEEGGLERRQSLDDVVDVGEWWKQLFGESEGKNHGGIFPASLCYTTDLHSLGQDMGVA